MLLLTFTAGANRYAVDVARVIELIPRVELRPVPHAPAFLAGLLGYRGEVVPVVDLSVLLDAPPCPDRLSTRIILVNAMAGESPGGLADRRNPAEHNASSGQDRSPDRNLLGLIAERVSDLVNVRPEQMKPAAVQVPQAGYLGAIVQTDEEIVQLIVVEKVWDAMIQGSAFRPDISIDLSTDQGPVNLTLA